MAQSYIPTEKFLSRKQETILQDDDVIYWKRMQQLTVFQEPSVVSSVRISPNKPYNVATTSSVRLTLYDNIVCEPLQLFSRFKKAVCSIDFRHDGKLLAIGGEEGKVRVFDIEKSTSSKIALRVMQASQSIVKNVNFSSQGDTIFSMSDDGCIKQYRIADTSYGVNAIPMINIQAHEDAIRCGTVSAMNDHIVVTGGYDHKVRVWDVRNKQKTIEMDCESPVEAVIFLPGEQLIATAAGTVVKIWDITGGGRQLSALQAHYKTVTSLRLATNSTCLLTAGIDRRINAFRTTNYSLIHSWSMPSPVLAMDISRDDQTLAVGMGNLTALYRRCEIKKEVTASAMVDDKRSVKRTAAPTVKLSEKNQPAISVDVIAKTADKLKIPRIDSLLSGFKHAAAIKLLFTGKHHLKLGGPVVSYIRVIVMRNAIHRAIAGQEEVVKQNLIKFLTLNIFVSEYFSILRIVVSAFFEVYRTEDLSPSVARAACNLKFALSRELEVQKMVSSLIGTIDMVVATTKLNVKSSTEIIEEDDIFGEPVFRAVGLEDLKPSDEKEEDEEVQEIL